jgi:hypothetical protein
MIMARWLSRAWRRPIRAAAMALFALALICGSARANGTLDGAWVVKLDLNQSSLFYRAQANLGLVLMTEVWVVEGQHVRAFGRNLVFRITGRTNGGRELTAVDEWTLGIDLEPKTLQNRPALASSVTMQRDAQGRVTITESVSQDKRVFTGHQVAAGAAAAPTACPDNAAPLAGLQQQLTAAQRERDQCRTEQARAVPRPPTPSPPVPTPIPAPAPAPAPVQAPAPDCPAMAGGGSAIQITGATAAGPGRVAVVMQRDDTAVTLRGRSGFLRDLSRAAVGARGAALGACGEFQLTLRPDPATQSVVLTTETQDGRRGSLTIELRRAP